MMDKVFVENTMNLIVLSENRKVADMRVHPNMVVLPVVDQKYTIYDGVSHREFEGIVDSIRVRHNVTVSENGAQVLNQTVVISIRPQPYQYSGL